MKDSKPKNQPSPPQAKAEKVHASKSADKLHQIPRNVNYYSHFLQESYITEKDIEWVLQLRNLEKSDIAAKLARIPNQAFSKADQKLECQKLKRLSRDVNYGGNSTPVLHLLRQRVGPTPHISQAEFETGLRSYANDKTLLEKERMWTTVPKSQRSQEFPEFLPPYKEVKEKKKSMSVSGKLTKITYSAFDPDTSLPPYQMKFRERNLQNVKHMFVPNIKMSTVQWQDSLRPLDPVKKEASHDKGKKGEKRQEKKK